MTDSLQNEIRIIRESGLFLSGWYLAQHREVELRNEDGVSHFCQIGWREGARPNPYFDPAWYCAQYPEIAAADVNPLLHYIAFGEAEGRDPCPHFFASWYRETYGLDAQTLCLRHFIERRHTGQVNPVPLFDAAYYLDSNRDVAAGGADPFEHFLAFGAAEARDPAPDFDVHFYRTRYGRMLGGQNPLLHYLANRDTGSFLPARPAHEAHAPAAVRRATRASPYFEEFRPVATHAPRRARLLAYYLPQFHRVPENEAWWGRGFSDWTNLGRAQPRFVGHLQPRIPRDLGYYALDDPATLRRQIEFATKAGLSGFVFYYYWFNRHRLLEAPLEQLLADPSLDFPFLVMWANENWTRRWDGLEREVLIAQEYLERDDAALIGGFARLFADPRYIRVQGRPLLMIYRVTIIPDASARIARWRLMFRELYNEDPLMIMAQSLGDYDPEPYGLDGAVEFPPHKLSQETPRINDSLDLLDPDFSATVHDYEALAQASLSLPEPPYPLIKTIVPGWDNDPRREGRGLVLHNATPAKYQKWLESLVEHANRNPFYGEPLLCVNAWNEWAEGAFLEPDLHFGAAFLNATGRALVDRDMAAFSAGILLVGHDAQPHGAQLLLLHLARRLARQWGLKVHLLLLGVGPLLGAYYETAEVTVAYDKTIIGGLLDKYREAGNRFAIVNSAASARVVAACEQRGIRTMLLVHEMPQLLKEYNLEIQARLGGASASHLIFSSAYLARRFCAAVDLKTNNIAILPQGNYQNIAPNAAARARIRRECQIEDTHFLILGAGFGHLRKGFDLFVQLARKLGGLRGDVCFVWVGDIEFILQTYLGPELAAAKAAGYFRHVPYTEHIGDYFAAADVFALTSREDPYPTVVMEALACGVPVVAFDGAGGIPELLRQERAGRVAQLADTDDFLAQLSSLLDHDKLSRLAPRLTAMARTKFDFGAYVEALLRLGQPALKTVSVAVVNYNYARYLPARLASIFAQTYPVKEILVLDDASTDDSLAVVTTVAGSAKRDVRSIPSTRNSGSPFAAWRRAVTEATGDFIWIAEADDDSTPEFLHRLIEAMSAADGCVLAFTDSRAVDDAGCQIMPNYQSYYFDAGAHGLSRSGWFTADDFARGMLTTRNLIPNVSAVLWRRAALLRALAAAPDLEDWKLAGDWRLYLAALAGQEGAVVYIAEPLNTHRRHAGGVTQRLAAGAHLAEIERMQTLAAELLDLDTDACTAQADDLARIAAQLGVRPTSTRKRARNLARRSKA
ncbi:MAG: glycoside hydrolase family 99-like domain-containing protein [Acidocella sp.]|nr:glycoside hydrolase family 99-like domain-containing protein [Acidocella sp.]